MSDPKNAGRSEAKQMSKECCVSVLILGPDTSAISGVAEHLRQLLAAPFSHRVRLSHFRVGSEGRKESFAKRLMRICLSPLVLSIVIMRLRAEVVHVNTSLNRKALWRDLLYVLVSKVLRRKVVCQVHGGSLKSYVRQSSWIGRFFVWVVAHCADVLVTVSERQRRFFCTLRPTSMTTVLVRNAIDIRDYDLVQKEFDRCPFKIGYIGRLQKEKGVLDLVAATGLLKKRGCRNVIVEIAGSGPALGEIRESITACDVSDMVRLIGPITGQAKRLFWTNIHLFVLPSYHEGLPYAVLESLASGTPMITTRVGGIPEVIVEGVHGLFVKPGEPKALADAIVALITDPHKLKHMSRECSEHARANFSVERLSRQFESIYTTVCLRSDALLAAD